MVQIQEQYDVSTRGVLGISNAEHCKYRFQSGDCETRKRCGTSPAITNGLVAGMWSPALVKELAIDTTFRLKTASRKEINDEPWQSVSDFASCCLREID